LRDIIYLVIREIKLMSVLFMLEENATEEILALIDIQIYQKRILKG